MDCGCEILTSAGLASLALFQRASFSRSPWDGRMRSCLLGGDCGRQSANPANMVGGRVIAGFLARVGGEGELFIATSILAVAGL